MESFVDISKMDRQVLAAIQDLLDLRQVSHEYAKEPTTANGERLVHAAGKVELSRESIRQQLSVIVKQANGDRESITGSQADNGIEIS